MSPILVCDATDVVYVLFADITSLISIRSERGQYQGCQGVMKGLRGDERQTPATISGNMSWSQSLCTECHHCRENCVIVPDCPDFHYTDFISCLVIAPYVSSLIMSCEVWSVRRRWRSSGKVTHKEIFHGTKLAIVPPPPGRLSPRFLCEILLSDPGWAQIRHKPHMFCSVRKMNKMN